MQICQIQSVTFKGFIIIISLHNYYYLFIYLFILVLFTWTWLFFSVIYLPEKNTAIHYNA